MDLNAANSPFTPEEVSFVEGPAGVARQAILLVRFTLHTFVATWSGKLGPEVVNGDVALDLGRGFLDIPATYTALDFKKRTWDVHLAGLAVSAQAMDQALDETFGLPRPLERKPCPSPETLSDIDAARVIIRLIRNAFAHNPFAPRWKCSGDARGVFVIPAIGFTFDTRDLDRIPLEAVHIGGIDGYLNLLGFCCESIEERESRKETGQ
jgi:hypothetical protein